MKAHKSFWFWLLVVGILAEAVALWFFRSHWSSLAPWSWMGAAGVFLLILLLSLFLRQRALLRKMTKARPAAVDTKNEEPWKQKTRTDLETLTRLVEGFAQKKCVLTIGTHRQELQALLAASGATPVSQREESRLSGELTALFDFYVAGNVCYFGAVDCELAHAVQADALHDKLAFVLDWLARTRTKAIDAVVLVNPALVEPKLAGEIGVRQQKILSGVMRQLGLDLPLYALFCPGSEASALAQLLQTEGVGTSFAISLQKNPQEQIGEGFSLIRSEFDSMLDALLLRARNKQMQASAVFHLRGLMKEWETSASALLSGVLSHYVGSERLLFRGIYLDPGISLVQRVAASTDAFGNVPEFDTGAKSSQESRVVPFCKFLGKETLMSRFCVRKQRKQTALAWVLSIAMVVCALGLLATALSSFSMIRTLRAEWDRNAASLSIASWESSQSVSEWFGFWNTAWSLYDQIENNRPWKIAPAFFTMGDREERAMARYDTLSRQLFVAGMRSQENNLRQFLTDSSGWSDPRFYQGLRNYLVLSTENRDKVDDDSLALILENVLQEELQSKPQAMGDAERAAFKEHAARMVERLYPYEIDRELVDQVRAVILENRKKSGNFEQLLARASAIAAFTLDSLGLQDDRLVKRTVEVPGAFTRRGYTEVILPALEQGGDAKADWVVGSSGGTAVAAIMGSEQIQALKEQYFSAYQKYWREFLDQLSISLPNDFQASAGVLEMLSSPYSVNDPKGMRAFLKGVCQQVDLRPRKNSNDSSAALAPKKMAAAIKKVDKLVDKAMDAVTGETPEESMAKYFAVPCALDSMAGKNRLDAYFKDLEQLSSLLSQANSTDKTTFDFGKSMLAGDRKNPLVHGWEEIEGLLETIPLSERPWVQAIFKAPLRNIGELLLPMLAEHVQNEYQEMVYKPYQSDLRLAYPFSRQSSREAQVEDVATYFNPQTGGVARFLKSTDGIFVQNGNRLDAKEWNGLGFKASASAVEGLRKNRRISETFFGSSSQWRGYQVTIEIKAPPNASVSLLANGQTLEVPGGTEKRITLKWPQANGSGIELKVRTASKEFTESFLGEWGVLKLLQRRGAVSIPNGKENIFSFQDKSYIIDVPVRVRFDLPVNPAGMPDLFDLDMNPEIISR